MNKQESGALTHLESKVDTLSSTVVEIHTDIKWIKRELGDLDDIRGWQDRHEDEHRALIWKIIAPFMVIAGAVGGFLGKLLGT